MGIIKDVQYYCFDMVGFEKRRGPYKRPRKVRRPDGKLERQMLMGLGMAMEVATRGYTTIKFAVQQRWEAQVLVCMMAPFLLPLACMLLIPLVCLGVPCLFMAAISASWRQMQSVQTVVDRQSLLMARSKSSKLLAAQSSSLRSLTSSGTHHAPRKSLPGRSKSLGVPSLRGKSVRSAFQEGGGAARDTLTGKSVRLAQPASRPLMPRARARGPPTRSKTFTFGGATTARAS